MNKKFLIAISLLPFIAAVPASAESLQDALAMAYTSNPQLQAERAGVMATAETVNQAKAARLPTVGAEGSIGYSAGNQSSPFFSGTNDYSPQTISGSAQQTLYGGGAIQGNIDLANVNLQMERNKLRLLENQVLLQALTAYVDVQRDMEVERIRTNNVEVLLKQLGAAEDRFDVGEITKTGVSQAKARLAAARAQLAGAKAQLAASRAAYEKVVGQAPGTLEPASEPVKLPDSFASAIQWAEKNSPSIQNAKLAELAAQKGVTIAKSGLRPSVTLGAQAYHQENAGYDGASAEAVATTLSLKVPLFTGGLSQSKVREAKQKASQARISVFQADRVVREQVSNAWNQLLAAKTGIQANEEAVTAQTLAFKGVEQENQVGLRTTLDVLDAEQELLSAKLALVSAKRDQLVAAYGLMAATGSLEAANLGLQVSDLDPKTGESSWVNKMFTTSIDD